MSILKKKVRLFQDFKEPDFDSYIDTKNEEHSSHIQNAAASTDLSIDSRSSSSTPHSSTRKSSRRQQNTLKQISEEDKVCMPQEGSSNIITGAKIIRNYAKAFCMFAHSDPAVTYIKALIEKWSLVNFDVSDFRRYIKQKKTKVASIDSLRMLLMPMITDSKSECDYKKMFQQLAVVFLKFFAVNWLFSGKVKHRIEHLKYRHKMLRRVVSPEFFSYLKGSVKKQ